MEKIRVGLLGKAGAGKTSLAQHWVKKYKFGRLSFAAQVRQVTQDLYLPETRENLQMVGQGMRSLIGKDVWVQIMAKKLKAWKGCRVVIDDVRYMNEVEFLQSQRFLLLTIRRPEEDRLNARPEMRESKYAEHPSENEWMDAKTIMISASNLDDLYREADAWLEPFPAFRASAERSLKRTKQDAMEPMWIIIDKAMSVVMDPEASSLDRQRNMRIVIHAVKAIAQLGVEQVHAKDILDVLRE